MTDTTPEAAPPVPREQPCPGRCNARARRAWRAYEEAWGAFEQAWEAYEQAQTDWETVDPETRGDAPEAPEAPQEPTVTPDSYGDPWWCDSCMGAIRRCLAELDDLMPLRLAQADGYQVPAAPAERVNGFGEPPSPSPGQDDLDTIIRTLNQIELEYRDIRGWSSPPRRGVAAPVLTSQLAWLSSHLDGILTYLNPATVPLERSHTLALAFGEWVLNEHGRLQGLTSTRPPLRHKPLPCPRCRQISLFRHDDETIRCHSRDANCGRIMTLKEYGEYEAQADQQVQHQEAS